MKFLYPFFLLILLSMLAHGQIDVLKFKKVQFGGIYNRTDLTGFYTLTDNQTGILKGSQKDYFSTFGFEAKHVVMNESAIFTANLEGFLYFLGRLASLGEKKELFYDWDTYLDPMTAGDLHNLKFKGGSSVNEVARVSNNHLFDFTNSWAFKKNGAGFAGFNLGLRTLGFPPRYTAYPTDNPANQVAGTAINGTWKVLYGFNLGIRKNLGSKVALLLIGGVNTGLNKWGSGKSTAIQVLYSPFISPTVYFGGKYGGWVGFYWEYMKGKDQSIGFTRRQPVGTPEMEETTTNEVSATQFQIKAGFYISFKRE